MRLPRFFHLLALLALLLAPAGMLGSHAAMAMPHQPAATSMGHCDDQQAPAEKEQRAMLDCAIACTAMPAAAPLLPPEQVMIAPLPAMVPVPHLAGLRPEAATPPPRYS